MGFPYAEIESFAVQFILPRLVDQIYKSNWLTKRALEQGRIIIDGGTQIEQPLQYQKTTVTNTDGAYQTLTPAYTQLVDKAVLQWKWKIAHTTLTDKDRVQCSGKAKIIDYVTARLDDMRRAMVDALGTGMYSAGADSTELDGLRLAIDTANTYAGISQSTYSWFRAAGEDSTNTTITSALLQTGYGACVDTGGEAPTCGVTTQTLFNAVWALFQPQQRYLGDGANVGWGQSVPFNGIPIVADNKCPANHFWWLNENHIKIFVHPDFNMAFVPWKEPINQPHASTAFLKFCGNILVDAPRTCYKYTAFTG